MTKTLSPEYVAYLKSNEWIYTKNKAWGIYGRYCAACGSRSQLDMHHRSYLRLYHEQPEDLVPLCRPCHDTVHSRVDALPHRGKDDLRQVTDIFIAERSAALRAKVDTLKPRNAPFIIFCVSIVAAGLLLPFLITLLLGGNPWGMLRVDVAWFLLGVFIAVVIFAIQVLRVVIIESRAANAKKIVSENNKHPNRI